MTVLNSHLRVITSPVREGRAATTPALSAATGEDAAPETNGDLGMFVLLQRWQDFLEVSGRTSESTRKQYRRYCLQFIADTLLDLRHVTEDDIVAWLAAQDPHGQTRGVVLRALKSFYGWAIDREETGVYADPTRHLRIRPKKYGQAPHLEPEDLERLFLAAGDIDPRARWALQLAYATGCRVGSLCGVMPSDVDLKAGWIEFRVAKGDKPYGVPLGSKGKEAAAELLELLEYTPRTVKTRRPTLVGVGEGTVWRWAKVAGERTGLKAWPHLLRHSTITQLFGAGVDARTVQEFANWEDLSLARRYAAPLDANLRAAADAL